MHRLRRALIAIVSTWLVSTGVAVAQAPPEPDVVPPAEPPIDAPAETPAPDAELIEVTGRVIDTLGRPVRRATVSVEGSPGEVRTDRDGRFTITAPMGS